MRSKRYDTIPTKIKIGIMTGGVREDKPQLELNMGDLIKGHNYQEIEGTFNGYQSIAGYERYDGTDLPSTIPILYEDPIDDSDREDRRSEITTVGDTACTGSVLGLFEVVTTGDVYAVREAVDTNSDIMWKATATGWEEVVAPTLAPLFPRGSYKFITGKFDLLTGLQREEVVFFTSSTYGPAYIDNDTGEIVQILHADLPTDTAPTSIVEFKNRLWLGYPDGRLFFSNVGDPTDFDSTTFSGNIYLEDDILELRVTVGDTLVVTCKSSIKLVKALSTGEVGSQVVVDYLFSQVSLSNDIGAVDNTCQAVLDDIMYIDERGLSSLTATQNYGDFQIKSFSRSINKTLLTNYANIVGSCTNKDSNQYRLFFSDGFGIIFTFNLRTVGTGTAKLVKGATTFRYLTPISCVSNNYFGSTDGRVYKIDSGTSFDGSSIITILETAYHHYNAPTYFKRFREVYFEGFIPRDVAFTVKAAFDYRYVEFIKTTSVEDLIISGALGGQYGAGKYGEMIYASSENQSSTFYVDSYGTSMSIKLHSENKYTEPHTISSMITQYSINARKM